MNTIINNITYQYYKILIEEQQKQQNYYKNLLLNKLLSFQKKDFIDNSISIIYQMILKEIPTKYNNLIYEDNFVNSQLFLQYANKFYNNIITQWSLGNFIKDAYTKTHRVVADYSKKISNSVNQILVSTGNALKQAWNNTVSFTKNAIGKGWDLVKKISSAIWEGIKKLGGAVVNFIKNVLDISKQGLTIGDNVAKGGHCNYNSPEEIPKHLNNVQNKVKQTIPFLNSTLDKAKQTGKQDNKKVQQLQKTLATGGNIDQKLKQATDSLGNNAKEKMDAQLKGPAIQEAKQFNKQIEKTIPKEEKQKLQTQSKINYNYNYTLDNNFFIKRQQQIIKQWIIDLAFKGLTPKTIIEEKYNKSFSKIQNDIIIGQSKLSFKTLHGNLIIQEINLNTNNSIIYQTNTQFIGKHLIWQQSQQKYKNINKVIFQQQQIQYKKIIKEQIDWLSVMLWAALVVGIILIVAILAAVIAGACHCVIPGSGFIVTALNTLLTPFYTVGAALTGGVTTFGSAINAGFAAYTTYSAVSGATSLAKVGYDAKIGGIDTGNTAELQKIKASIQSGRTTQSLKQQLSAL